MLTARDLLDNPNDAACDTPWDPADWFAGMEDQIDALVHGKSDSELYEIATEAIQYSSGPQMSHRELVTYLIARRDGQPTPHSFPG